MGVTRQTLYEESWTEPLPEAERDQLPTSDALERFLEWKNTEERLSPMGD